jgi:hypothetical protein
VNPWQRQSSHHHHPQQQQQKHQQQLFRRYSSTTNSGDGSLPAAGKSKFVVVDHAQAYEMAMQGRHGQQLALARLEGVGKDDPPFDPFLADEGLDEYDDDDQIDEYDEDTVEAEIVDNRTKEEYADGGYEADDDTDDDVFDEDDRNGHPTCRLPLRGTLRRRGAGRYSTQGDH